MTPELDQLVSDAAGLTGVATPEWLDDDAPVLTETAAAPSAAADGGFYMIGIIGGKDVGKSALVNAIVGQEITPRTSHGPGTETVIAYAHSTQFTPLQTLLEAEVPGRYSIIRHDLPHLARQVLLDLPDIDSHWAGHVALTRKMLRHMLFPVWMQSIEKYADRQPQELLAKVAAGNAPENFVFCLNKVDQIDGKESDHTPDAPPLITPGAEPSGDAPGLPANANGALNGVIKELQEDYAARLRKVLTLEKPPRVWAISAIHPERYDLPTLRGLLAQQKSEDIVRDSKAQAATRQKLSVQQWLTALDLPGRAARAARLQQAAEELVNERLAEPLIEGVLPQLSEDPLYRQSVIDECMSRRVARWPLVGIMHGIFSTIGGFIRRNTEAAPRPLFGHTADTLVDQHLTAVIAPTGGKSLADLVQTTFAVLQQTHPSISALYAQRKLWESLPAAAAAGDLRNELVETVNRQRSVASSRADRHRTSQLADLMRFLLTFGALIYFPFIQPIVQYLFAVHPPGSPGLMSVLVGVLSMSYLLNALTFFFVYFSLIWLALRWDTQQRVARQFARWSKLESMDPPLSLSGRTMDWITGLLRPVRAAKEELETVAKRAEALRGGRVSEPRV